MRLRVGCTHRRTRCRTHGPPGRSSRASPGPTELTRSTAAAGRPRTSARLPAGSGSGGRAAGPAPGAGRHADRRHQFFGAARSQQVKINKTRSRSLTKSTNNHQRPRQSADIQITNAHNPPNTNNKPTKHNHHPHQPRSTTSQISRHVHSPKVRSPFRTENVREGGDDQGVELGEDRYRLLAVLRRRGGLSGGGLLRRPRGGTGPLGWPGPGTPRTDRRRPGPGAGAGGAVPPRAVPGDR